MNGYGQAGHVVISRRGREGDTADGSSPSGWAMDGGP